MRATQTEPETRRKGEPLDPAIVISQSVAFSWTLPKDVGICKPRAKTGGGAESIARGTATGSPISKGETHREGKDGDRKRREDRRTEGKRKDEFGFRGSPGALWAPAEESWVPSRAPSLPSGLSFFSFSSFPPLSFYFLYSCSSRTIAFLPSPSRGFLLLLLSLFLRVDSMLVLYFLVSLSFFFWSCFIHVMELFGAMFGSRLHGCLDLMLVARRSFGSLLNDPGLNFF